MVPIRYHVAEPAAYFATETFNRRDELEPLLHLTTSRFISFRAHL